MVMSNLNRDVLAFQPEKALFQDLQNFSKSAYEEARLVVSEKMPKKILKLTKFLKEKDEYRSFFEREKEPNGKRSKKDGAGESLDLSEAFILAESEFALLKDEVLELVEMASVVKLWLQLNVPRIEDGNNFGVSIQTDTVGELARVEDAALMTVENWSKFLMVRAKIVGKMHKHSEPPTCNMYRMTLEALDEKQLRSVWIGWIDLRNNYAIIYDLLAKNIEKLLNPRSSNTGTMY